MVHLIYPPNPLPPTPTPPKPQRHRQSEHNRKLEAIQSKNKQDVLALEEKYNRALEQDKSNALLSLQVVCMGGWVGQYVCGGRVHGWAEGWVGGSVGLCLCGEV